jgi:pimeloyl-ACP methyl ester carboxylesterase
MQKGEGRPVVLLHGIGMSHRAWLPVVDRLARQRRVIAFDTAGFGGSAPLPARHVPDVPSLVASLGESLHAMGIHEPVDIVGNSLGGLMALEAARQKLASRVVGISPAGLWRHKAPFFIKPLFHSMRFTLKRLPGVSQRAVSLPLLREALLAVPLSAGSRHMPTSAAVGTLHDFVNCDAFERTLNAIEPFKGGRGLDVPVSVAFGRRDWLLTRSARLRDELPAHTRWTEPANWGHVPMWVDPVGVADYILAELQA